MKKIKINYTDIAKMVKTIVEQEESDVVTLTPEEVKQYLEYVSYNGDMLGRFPQFRGKKIKVKGSLNLSDTPLTSLGPIIDVEKNLNIRNTKVRSWGNYQGSKYRVYYTGTPLHRIEIQREIDRRQSELDDYRESDAWALDKGDPTGQKAWALLYLLDADNIVNVLNEDQKNEVSQLRERLNELNDELENTTDPEEIDRITTEINETEESLDEYSKYIDVYDLYPDGKYYNMTEFVINRYEFVGDSWAVGTDSETERSAQQFARDMIDGTGIDGFNKNFLKDYIDEGALIDYLDYDSDVRDNLEVYFNSDDYDELSSYQMNNIKKLEEKIVELRKNYESAQQNRNEELSTEIEEEIDEIEEEISDIKSSPEGISEEKISEKVEELNDDVRRNPFYKIEEYSLDLKNFIDEDELINAYVRSDGYEIISRYDGNIDNIEVNDTTYYIVRVNG